MAITFGSRQIDAVALNSFGAYARVLIHFNNPAPNLKVTLVDEYPDEDRFWDLAEVKGRVLLLVYTLRGEKVRCVSFRVATRNEEVSYYGEIKNR